MYEPTAEQPDLAKQAQNPIANLISVPFQNNINFGLGPHDRTQNLLLIQPVIPIRLTDGLNLITRTIAPVLYQPDVESNSGGEFGLGDINESLFFSPSKPSKIVWGVGPIVQFPTATHNVLGTGKWEAGPTAVALTMPGHWVIGALINNLWSFAGDNDRKKVSLLTFQYFINYNFSHGWYLTSSPVNTANWKADNNNRWTIPFGGGGGKIFHVGKQALNFQTQAFYNAERPAGAADWTLRIQLVFLFPGKHL
ncbi:MAG: neuromedin U [Deltaproteobacteria bacterium]|nr:neuromedin U [Deltaproteobacteria bacterium]